MNIVFYHSRGKWDFVCVEGCYKSNEGGLSVLLPKYRKPNTEGTVRTLALPVACVAIAASPSFPSRLDYVTAVRYLLEASDVSLEGSGQTTYTTHVREALTAGCVRT